MKKINEENKILGKRMKEMRKRIKYSLQSVSEKLEAFGTSVSAATLQRYESGEIARIPINRIEALAKIYRCDPLYLIGLESATSHDGLLSNVSAVNSTMNVVEMDVYGLASAGNGSLDIEPRKETFIIASDEKIPKNSIVIGVVGDSMEPTLYEGDRILINTNDCVEWQLLNNKIVVVDINEERLVKVVRFNNFTLEFHSLNQFYPPVIVKQGDEVKCLGVLVELLKRNMRKIKF